jgi:hypothetical protein
MSDRRYDAQELLKSACLKRQVRFADLIADTGSEAARGLTTLRRTPPQGAGEAVTHR